MTSLSIVPCCIGGCRPIQQRLIVIPSVAWCDWIVLFQSAPVAAAVEADGALICQACSSQFRSKNKLFDHLKKTGHAVIKTVGKPTAPVASETKKGKKKR